MHFRRDAALQEQEAGLRADKYRELETQRQELENRYANILDTKLAEQRHALLSQAAQDKVRGNVLWPQTILPGWPACLVRYQF